ncbi:hypothetical protein N6H14_20700 [Paenibacillus sp. CC-CFT747]|nr:hypothetical protein N6H14_20700 [Paenibacillus sp. CC-CFT747]
MIREWERESKVSLQMWRKAQLRLQQKFVNRLVKGKGFYSDQTFLETIRPLQLEWIRTLPCAVMAIELSGYKNAIQDWKDQQLIEFAMDNVLSELTEPLEHTVLLPQGRNRWILVAGLPQQMSQGGEEQALHHVQTITQNWVASMERYTHGRIAIGISRLASHWGEWPHRLTQAMEALAYQRFMGDKVLRYDRTAAILGTKTDGQSDQMRLLDELFAGNKKGSARCWSGFPPPCRLLLQMPGCPWKQEPLRG